MDNDGADKRAFPRINVQRTVKYRVKTEKEMKSGRVENISGGGMCLYTREPLKEGDVVAIEFKLPGNIGHVIADAKVVWAKSASDSKYESNHWAGINFEKIPEHSREDIVEYVTRKIRAVRAKEEVESGNDGKCEVKGNLPRVLIVDDDVDLLELMKELLGDEFNVTTTRNGSAALELAETEKPDLIFLDIQMPILDGLHTLVMLKENEKTKPIPVLMLSVSTKKSEVLEAFKSGAAGFVAKPFQPDALIQKVKNIIVDPE